MDVSVVIPTRDRPEFLALTLRTALWQQDVDSEVIVVDDGSESGTAAVVRQLADSRVRLLRNTGPPEWPAPETAASVPQWGGGSPSSTTMTCGRHAS